MDNVTFFCKVNKQDGSRDAALEAKHTPVIKVDGPQKSGVPFQVTIDVGEGKHPNQHDHFIQWIDLYAKWVFLGRVDLSAVTTSPKVTLQVTLYHEGEATLRSFAKCTLHGVWEGTTEVTITKGS